MRLPENKKIQNRRRNGKEVKIQLKKWRKSDNKKWKKSKKELKSLRKSCKREKEYKRLKKESKSNKGRADLQKFSKTKSKCRRIWNVKENLKLKRN